MASRTPFLTGKRAASGVKVSSRRPGRQHGLTVRQSLRRRPSQRVRTASKAPSTACGPVWPRGAPPPCATSSLPPPPPPSALAAIPASLPAARPLSRPASLTATTTTGRSSGTAASTTTAGCPAGSRPRTSSASLRIPSAGVPSGSRCATRLTPPTSSAPRARSGPEASSWELRSCPSSRCASRSLVTRPATRSGSSSGGAFSCSLSWLTSRLSLARNRNASMPTSASTRRTPAPMEDSPSTLITPS